MKILKGIGYWLIQLTWGLPCTLFGAVVALGCLITGHKPKRFHYNIYFVFGTGGWGFEAGGFFFVSKDADDSLELKQHEAGHGLQNLMLGVFMPFVVSIPSAIRFWYREWLVRVKKVDYWSLAPYDSMWFEGWATKLGKKYFK